MKVNDFAKEIQAVFELAMDVEERLYNAVESDEVSRVLDNSKIGMCNGACKGFEEDDPNNLCPSCKGEFDRLRKLTRAKAGLNDEDIAALRFSHSFDFTA